MKRTHLLITLIVLLHLFVIDLTFYWITAGALNTILGISAYNVIWVLIAITIGTHSFNKTKGNQRSDL